MMLLPLVTALALAAQLPPADAANIDLSTAIVQRVGDSLWPSWSTTPFQIDLLTQDGPVLVNVDKPFTPPNFPKDLEATLVLQTGPIIVIGEPKFAQTDTPTRWSVTLLHEHFHQWQYSWAPYQDAVTSLNLAHGDKTAMWMLNYAFPYTDPRVDARYTQMATALADALQAMRTPGFSAAVQRYLQARAAFREILSPDDYKYFAFQCWQEGVARYTEIRVAQYAADAHAANPSFLSDAQAAALMQDSARTYASVVKRLRTQPLQDDKRVNFYAVGAGEALLLDQTAPGWQKKYLNRQMDLSALLVR
jgi:hypothetical protein